MELLEIIFLVKRKEKKKTNRFKLGHSPNAFKSRVHLE